MIRLPQKAIAAAIEALARKTPGFACTTCGGSHATTVWCSICGLWYCTEHVHDAADPRDRVCKECR